MSLPHHPQKRIHSPPRLPPLRSTTKRARTGVISPNFEVHPRASHTVSVESDRLLRPWSLAPLRPTPLATPASDGSAVTPASSPRSGGLVARLESLETASDACFAAVIARELERQCVQSGSGKTAYDVDDSVQYFYSRVPVRALLLSDYVLRIVEKVSRTAVVLALVYLDRVRVAHAHMALTEMNVHRVFLTAVLLGTKYYKDEPVRLEYFRWIGLLPSSRELRGLETDFLKIINWSLFVHHDVYDRYSRDVLEKLAR